MYGTLFNLLSSFLINKTQGGTSAKTAMNAGKDYLFNKWRI